VGGLGRGVYDARRADGLDQLEHAGAIANVDSVVDVVVERVLQTFLIPRSIAIGTEELAALIVVDAMNGKASFVKGLTNF